MRVFVDSKFNYNRKIKSISNIDYIRKKSLVNFNKFKYLNPNKLATEKSKKLYQKVSK